MARRILITKAKGQNDALKNALSDRGFDVSVLPCLEIEPIEHKAPSLHSHDLVFFVSPNAVHYFQGKIIGEIYAVGPSTQQALQEKNITATIPKKFSSEGLLKLIAPLDLKGRKAFIICGDNTKSLLGDTLKRRGACVTYVCCYQSRAPHYSKREIEQFCQQRFDLIISTSQQSLLNLNDILMEQSSWLHQHALLVIAQHMGSLGRFLGFTSNIYFAENPTNEAIVAAVMNLYNRG